MNEDDPGGLEALPEDEVRAAARLHYARAIAAQRRMEGLEEALRALILAPPWKQSRGSADVWCEWCEATTYGGASAEHFHDLALHEEACPWRKARALLGLDGRALD